MTLTLSYDTKTRKYYLAELLEGNEIRIIEELGYKYNSALREFNKIVREL